MKPITHPLAIAFVEERARGRSGQATRDWVNANCPLYAAPTPLPAPALGMRVWREIHDANGLVRSPRPYDITELRPDETWLSFFDDTSEIGAITDYRTGEVLWRRQ